MAVNNRHQSSEWHSCCISHCSSRHAAALAWARSQEMYLVCYNWFANAFSVPLAEEARHQLLSPGMVCNTSGTGCRKRWKRSPTICHGFIHKTFKQQNSREFFHCIDDVLIRGNLYLSQLEWISWWPANHQYGEDWTPLTIKCLSIWWVLYWK